jgi:nucleolar MIF4G domain-containing protein 1
MQSTLGHLLTTLLKVLNFAYLQAKTKMFLEVLLGTAFKQLSRTSKASSSDSSVVDSAIAGMIMRAKDTPQVITGLQYFLSREADLEKIASSSSDRKLLKRASKTMMLVLTQLSTSMS